MLPLFHWFPRLPMHPLWVILGLLLVAILCIIALLKLLLISWHVSFVSFLLFLALHKMLLLRTTGLATTFFLLRNFYMSSSVSRISLNVPLKSIFRRLMILWTGIFLRSWCGPLASLLCLLSLLWLAYVTSPKFSIAINGEVHGFFSSGRSIHQGDPMSPYLFTLVMEIFTSILNAQT